MLLGEIAPGGVGSGLYGMLVLAVVAVFLAGLMVGRTPEYLGKKIGQREITLVALYVLTMPAVVLIGSAIAISTDAGLAGLQEAARTGSRRCSTPSRPPGTTTARAFAGLTTGTPFYNTLLGRLHARRPVRADRARARPGRAVRQPAAGCPAGAGTLPTHKPLFVVLLTGVALVVVGLTFVPVLSLGPIVESLS